jgi:hypothetical protein
VFVWNKEQCGDLMFPPPTVIHDKNDKAVRVKCKGLPELFAVGMEHVGKIMQVLWYKAARTMALL